MSSEIERLVAAIDEEPDHLHGDHTAAVHALVAHGLAALPHVLPLLEGDHDDRTRMRAQRVLEGVTRAWARSEASPRPLGRGDLHAWESLWRDNGAYDWRAPSEQRAKSVASWRAWIDGQRSQHGP